MECNNCGTYLDSNLELFSSASTSVVRPFLMVSLILRASALSYFLLNKKHGEADFERAAGRLRATLARSDIAKVDEIVTIYPKKNEEPKLDDCILR